MNTFGNVKEPRGVVQRPGTAASIRGLGVTDCGAGVRSYVFTATPDSPTHALSISTPTIVEIPGSSIVTP
ncbi:hypothetical protein BH23GEM8_BH23GEM8_07410 [soil metagenome]